MSLARLVTGKVPLFRGQIGGNLWLNGARVGDVAQGFSVHCAQLRLGGGLYAAEIEVAGGFNLWGATAFSIELTNARLAAIPAPRCARMGSSSTKTYTAPT